ncbi:MAG: transglutaminase-like domain-containing protein [Longimicrobiales bacterium]
MGSTPKAFPQATARTRRKPGRKVLAASILLLWFATVGLQVRREVFQPELARMEEAALFLSPGVNFFTLEAQGRSVGLATSRLDTVPEGFVLEDFMSLELPALGQTGRAVVRTEVEVSKALVMQSFVFSLDSEVGKYEARGTVEGDTLLTVELDSGSGVETLVQPLDEPPVFAAMVPIRVAIGEGLEVGQRVQVPVFDPSTLSNRTVDVEVLDHDTLVVADSAAMDAETGRWAPAHYDSIPAWKIAEVFGGLSIESWIDQDGRVLSAESPVGFSMRKTEYELARQAQEDARADGGGGLEGDVILSTAIQSSVILGDLEDREEVRYLLSGVDLTGFDLDGGRQELRGDTLIVRRDPWSETEAGYELPYKRMDLRESLAAEPLIQSDHELIHERARTVTSGLFRKRNPKVVAERLTSHVHGFLEKKITLSVPSALQVLEAGAGDCNEHTVLYVALARSLGLPTRTAVGLAYVDGAFYYHAWPEVWMGEWFAVDPTFGQTPADAGHIRFVVGGLAQQIEIARLIGRLKIEVLEAE